MSDRPGLPAPLRMLWGAASRATASEAHGAPLLEDPEAGGAAGACAVANGRKRTLACAKAGRKAAGASVISESPYMSHMSAASGLRLRTRSFTCRCFGASLFLIFFTRLATSYAFSRKRWCTVAGPDEAAAAQLLSPALSGLSENDGFLYLFFLMNASAGRGAALAFPFLAAGGGRRSAPACAAAVFAALAAAPSRDVIAEAEAAEDIAVDKVPTATVSYGAELAPPFLIPMDFAT